MRPLHTYLIIILSLYSFGLLYSSRLLAADLSSDSELSKTRAAPSISKYERSIAIAKAAYTRSMIEATEQLISDLETDLKKSMDAHDLDQAKLIDTRKSEAEIALKELQDSGKSPFRIIEAKWGGGKNWVDVTARIRELLENGEDINATSSCLKSDPSPGWKKELRVIYIKSGNKKEEIRIREGDSLDLKPTP